MLSQRKIFSTAAMLAVLAGAVALLLLASLVLSLDGRRGRPARPLDSEDGAETCLGRYYQFHDHRVGGYRPAVENLAHDRIV